MATLKDLSNRISSVKSTKKITKAMQMVAAAKLRRAQDAAEAARPFSERMARVITNLTGSDPSTAPRLMTGTGSDDVHLLLVCTSERGLAGGFNANIVRKARQHIRSLKSEGKTVKIVCVGKKGYDMLRRDHGQLIIDRIDLRDVRNIGFENANEIGHKVISMFENEQFDVCTIFFAEFENALTQHPKALQLIPVRVEDLDAGGEAAEDIQYEYEPSEGEILQDLIPRNISVQIFRALLENTASEHGARMTAMDNATRNADEMIDDLTLDYNRQRQAKITTELIEIIAGAEAL